MLITNHIIWNVIGGIFHHLTRGGEGKNIQVKLIKLNQRDELIKSNQRMGLINSNQAIQ